MCLLRRMYLRAIPCGTIGYGVEAMASVYGFKITLTGRGGHGSAPEGCIDPINAGVEVYHALQALIARECPPSAEAKTYNWTVYSW